MERLHDKTQFRGDRSVVLLKGGMPGKVQEGEDYPAARMVRARELTKMHSPYSGGDKRVVNGELQEAQFNHVGIAFETVGWTDMENIVPACVLHTLWLGGDAFSAGGPGKGMFSRLFEEVLNKHAWVEGCHAHIEAMHDASLLSIRGQCPPRRIDDMSLLIMQQFQRILRDPISEQEISRARNMCKGSLFSNLDQTLCEFEDMARQILSHGERIPADVLSEQIDAVTEDDLKRIVDMALKTPPTVVCFGADVTTPKTHPNYDEIRYWSDALSKAGPIFSGGGTK